MSCISNKYHYLLVLLSFLFLSSCAPLMQKQVEITPLERESYHEAVVRWQYFLENDIELSSILAEGSLRFGYEGTSQRANFLLWTNDSSKIRVDISAAFTTYASIYANQDKKIAKSELSIYLPTYNKLLHYDTINTLEAFSIGDIYFPFSIQVLVELMQGLFPYAQIDYPYYYFNAFTKVFRDDVSFTYEFHIGNRVEYFTLDLQMRPIKWQIDDWVLEFAYNETTYKPSKIVAKHDSGNSLTLYIKKLSVNTDDYSEDSFKITIPDGVEVIYNDNF